MHLAETKVRTVGIDYLSVGGYRSDGAKVHHILLQAGIWIIEGLDLSPVTGGRYEMICLPVKLHGSDGAPARAILRPLGGQPRPGRLRGGGAMRVLVVGGGPAGVAAALQARGAGRRRHAAGSRAGRRDQPEPRAGAGPHPGPGRPAGPGLVLMGALRPGRPPAGPQPRSGPGQHRPGRPLRPRQERHRRPPAPQRDRPGRAPRPRPVHRPAHRARRRRPQLARRPHRHRGRLPRGSAAGPGRRARADLPRHLDPQSPAATGHGYRRSRHRLPDGLDLRRPRSRCPAHRSRPPARARR